MYSLICFPNYSDTFNILLLQRKRLVQLKHNITQVWISRYYGQHQRKCLYPCKQAISAILLHTMQKSMFQGFTSLVSADLYFILTFGYWLISNCTWINLLNIFSGLTLVVSHWFLATAKFGHCTSYMQAHFFLLLVFVLS